MAGGDALGTARVVQRVSSALMSRSYRSDAGESESEDKRAVKEPPAGAGAITAALRAVQDEARSNVPALGYTVPYAIEDILPTAWGPVLVALMSIGK